MQYLRLPIDNFKPTAGYKSKKYKSHWGWSHYGIDCVSGAKKKALYALGSGTVAAAGLDGLNGKTTGKGSGCGFCLVITYEDCKNWYSGNHYDVVVTYMHMAQKPRVKKGDNVTAGTLLGYYGNTGANTTGPHLHIQFDRDTKWPLYCCGLSAAGHNLLKRGTSDTTVDPTHLLFVGEGQRITAPASAWYDKNEFLKIPKMPGVSTDKKVIKVNKIVDGKIIIGSHED